MPVFQVTKADYEVLSSLFKIGKNARYDVPWKEFVKVMGHLGYSYRPGGYNGKGRTTGSRFEFESQDDGNKIKFHVPHVNKMEPYKQDDVRRDLERLLGWTKSSFVIV